MKKLVRNSIPDIIEREGKTVRVRILGDEEYIIELRKKLNEEIAEADRASSVMDRAEEIADIYEVLEALTIAYRIDPQLVTNIKLQKKNERGGFEKRIFLDEII